MSAGHDDFAAEPAPDLSTGLPDGEVLLWQGSPDWKALAWRVYHLRFVLAYFVVLAGWNGASTALGGQGLRLALISMLPVTAAGAVAAGLLTLIAWLASRTTVYSITTRRVVMRIGIALPITFNLPFASIEAVAVRRSADGSGDICLQMSRNGLLSYLVLWPHVRPWVWRQPQPSLRAVPALDRVATLLGHALAATLPGPAPAPARLAAPVGHEPGGALMPRAAE